ncbi:MAG: hypothetical protein A3J28_09220 [Acidobacteria bacterium RIFCSPLOWO2_12_FULL_60_22]|nr:MAG: hypothetical protein A3J28_09220 [Acidobacteria bacterium RIFCSPLOWO2_12_FULL_60_22]
MARFNPKSFAQPDLLKKVQVRNLLELLIPYQPFFEEKGFSFPSDGVEEINYLKLAGILAQPDENMESSLVEALHVIGNIGTDENFDELLDIARRNTVDTGDGEATAIDLATRIWLAVPEALVRMERAELFHRRKKFESFRAKNPKEVAPAESLPRDFTELEQDLDGWFESRKRGVGCKVIRKDSPGEVRFLIQHGQPCKREPSRKGAQSTCTFFRPEKTDVVIYDLVNNEFRINTSTLGELRLYVQKFGKHLFGDEEKFVYTAKYTLDPLREQGPAALCCRDVPGIEWVRLQEIEYSWPNAFNLAEKYSADDVFQSLAALNRSIDLKAEILKAVFSVKLEGEKKPRSVSIRPRNTAAYGRGEKAVIIETWLRARGFILIGMAARA